LSNTWIVASPQHLANPHEELLRETGFQRLGLFTQQTLTLCCSDVNR